jgi:dUTP pyrophosphatase
MNIELKILNKEFYRDYENETTKKIEYCLPKYATRGSAGIDLLTTEDVTIYPGEVKAIHTGLAIWISTWKRRYDVWKEMAISFTSPEGRKEDEPIDIAGVISPRSGLGTKGLVLANLTGWIDEDYQGELIIQAWNRNNEYKTVDKYSNEGPWQEIEWNTENKIELKAGDRIAQLVFIPIIKAQWELVEEFSEETKRGTGGFGHTGD